jgi:hypothetical protein
MMEEFLDDLGTMKSHMLHFNRKSKARNENASTCQQQMQPLGLRYFAEKNVATVHWDSAANLPAQRVLENQKGLKNRR